MTVKVAVIYYSATGTVHALAQAVAEGAVSVGADVRLRPVAELAPDEAIDENPRWRRHADATASITRATVDDLAWADAFAFGTPSRFGTPAAQLKQFIDQAGGLWRDGELADKPVTAFTSAFNRHGGSEATILSLGNVFYHWGALIIPPGFTDATVYAAGGNPYGTSSTGESPDPAVLAAARYQGQRLARITSRLLAGNRVAASGNGHASLPAAAPPATGTAAALNATGAAAASHAAGAVVALNATGAVTAPHATGAVAASDATVAVVASHGTGVATGVTSRTA